MLNEEVKLSEQLCVTVHTFPEKGLEPWMFFRSGCATMSCSSTHETAALLRSIANSLDEAYMRVMK